MRAASIPQPDRGSGDVDVGSTMCVAMGRIIVASCRWRVARGSGKENLDAPLACGFATLVKLTPVQAARHSLPELDTLGHQAKARPVRRPRHRSALEAALELGDAALEELLIANRPTLLRCPCTDLTATATRGKIGVGLRALDRRRLSLDAYLDFHR